MKLLRNIVIAGALMVAGPGSAMAEAVIIDGTDPGRQARWELLSEYVFGDQTIEDGDHLISLEAPSRAQDPALVPITIRIKGDEQVEAVHLLIDENPSPYAAKMRFGPAGRPDEINLRVRVNAYTNVHAVAETSDGKLYQTRVFVKAAGGCAAPITVSDAEALQNAGEMRMKFDEGDSSGSQNATLMIRHPNFSGMQMNQVTRHITPARYLDEIKVSHDGQTVFELTGDISLSSDPVIGFTYNHAEDGLFTVHATDTNGGSWEQEFPLQTKVVN